MSRSNIQQIEELNHQRNGWRNRLRALAGHLVPRPLTPFPLGPGWWQVSEIAGVKLDRDVNVVAFKDGREIPLPPGTGFLSADGKVCACAAPCMAYTFVFRAGCPSGPSEPPPLVPPLLLPRSTPHPSAYTAPCSPAVHPTRRAGRGLHAIR